MRNKEKKLSDQILGLIAVAIPSLCLLIYGLCINNETMIYSGSIVFISAFVYDAIRLFIFMRSEKIHASIKLHNRQARNMLRISALLGIIVFFTIIFLSGALFPEIHVFDLSQRALYCFYMMIGFMILIFPFVSLFLKDR